MSGKRKKTANIKRGRSSRRKGKDGELEAAKALSKVLGIGMRRGQQFSGLGGDDITGWDGVHVEVKRTETLNVYKAMDQSTDDTDQPDIVIPIVLHRRNDRPWLVICYLNDLRGLSNRVQEALRDE